MRWLIVEDALRDRKGHWFEYLCAFRDGLPALGDEVEILADRKAESFVLERLAAKPVLPESIWHRMNNSSSILRRSFRVFHHGCATRCSIENWLKTNPAPDFVFVPSVLVHHLLGWFWMIKRRKLKCRVLLFFPNLPIRLNSSGHPEWMPSPTTRLFACLCRRLKLELARGQVVLGVETHSMQKALAVLTGLPVSYFPHPVARFLPVKPAESACNGLTMACYGPARHEKGSDLLMMAVSNYVRRFPNTRARFVFQWLEDFRSDDGTLVRLDQRLLFNPKVKVIQRYFNDGEYPEYLGGTDVLLLPYRISSYALRVSRVMIEAMVNALPVVVTDGTTLASQAGAYGSNVRCKDGDVESLVQAIRETELCHDRLREKALDRCAAARSHFSVRAFREGVRALPQH